MLTPPVFSKDLRSSLSHRGSQPRVARGEPQSAQPGRHAAHVVAGEPARRAEVEPGIGRRGQVAHHLRKEPLGGRGVAGPVPRDRLVPLRVERSRPERGGEQQQHRAGTEPGEDPALAASRECEEEIGLAPGRVERLQAFYPTPGYCDELMTFYRCLDLRQPDAGSTAQKDEDEDIEPRTFTVEEARRLVSSGEIVDLKTVAGLSMI